MSLITYISIFITLSILIYIRESKHDKHIRFSKMLAILIVALLWPFLFILVVVIVFRYLLKEIITTKK